MSNEIRFTDGSGYERYMGAWSRLAGEQFLEWIAPSPGLRWLDVGCGNGAFTELIVDRCAPASVDGVDPSIDQIEFARTRPAARMARFQIGNATSLPFPNDAFDAAVMPLVISFVPDPAAGVAEMARVVAPGGIVSAYMWDQPDGGLPYGTLIAEMESMGVHVPVPPSVDASRADVMQNLWIAAGLDRVETRSITVRRTFENFEDFWATVQLGPAVSRRLASMSAGQLRQLEDRMRGLLQADASGHISYTARANAVQGRVTSSAKKVDPHGSPETVAMMGFPEASCRVLHCQTTGDDAYVLLNTGSSAQPYLYGISCFRENGRWFEAGGGNGPGWSASRANPGLGLLTFWDSVSADVDAVRVQYADTEIEAPVVDRTFFLIWPDVPSPDDHRLPPAAWPRVVGIRKNGEWQRPLLGW